MIDQERCAAAAIELADGLAAACVQVTGGVQWVDPAKPGKAIGSTLYRGSAGVAAFLAAVGKATDDPRRAELAVAALAAPRRLLRALVAKGEAGDAQPLSMGGCVGVPSMLYGLLVVGRLLGDDALLDEAHAASWLITDARLQADQHLDVMSGVAGALAVLLALDTVRPEPNARGQRPIDLASLAVRHLEASRIRGDDGVWRWSASAARRLLAGFGHGAAGILDGLARYALRTGDASVLATIRDGIEAENQLFDATVGNWQDTRFDEADPVYGVRWCHGGPGVALGRAVVQELDDPHLVEVATADRAAGVAIAARPELDEIDYLCCGTFGRTEILAAVGESADAIEPLVDAAFERAEAAGGWSGAAVNGALAPAFFTGAAGIGWALLRLAGEDLPHLLALR